MSTTVQTRQVSEGGVTRSVASQSDARFGNTRKVTADNQAVSGTFVYDAFGTVTYSSGSPGLRNRYCGNWGYRDDGDAGLLHVGARYYDPTTGRFTTRDTVLTEHPYVYCDGDPVNKVDITGRLPVLVVILVAAGAALLAGGCKKTGGNSKGSDPRKRDRRETAKDLVSGFPTPAPPGSELGNAAGIAAELWRYGKQRVDEVQEVSRWGDPTYEPPGKYGGTR